MTMFKNVYGICTAGAAFSIAMLSVLPPLQIVSIGFANWGTWAHVSAYVMLCFLSGMWLLGRTVRYPLAYAALFCVAFGIMIECVQSLVPYRHFEAVDILINCSAVLVAAAVLHCVIRLVRTVSEPGNKSAAHSYRPTADQ